MSLNWLEPDTLRTPHCCQAGKPDLRYGTLVRGIPGGVTEGFCRLSLFFSGGVVRIWPLGRISW